MTEQRYITVCQHHTVHVRWDNMTLSWSVSEFRHFAHMIKQQLHIETIPEPAVVIQVNQMLVGWSTADFYQLADMVLVALVHLDMALEQLAGKQAATRSWHFSRN